MTRKAHVWHPQYCDDVQGRRREEIIAEHLHWLEHRHKDAPRDLSEYPLAKWLAEHRQSLARHRAETLASNYRNTKTKRVRDPKR